MIIILVIVIVLLLLGKVIEKLTCIVWDKLQFTTIIFQLRTVAKEDMEIK